jgi:hypothetical protein
MMESWRRFWSVPIWQEALLGVASFKCRNSDLPLCAATHQCPGRMAYVLFQRVQNALAPFACLMWQSHYTLRTKLLQQPGTACQLGGVEIRVNGCFLLVYRLLLFAKRQHNATSRLSNNGHLKRILFQRGEVCNNVIIWHCRVYSLYNISKE